MNETQKKETMNFPEAFTFLCKSKKNKVKIDDWSDGKYFFVEDGHLYMVMGKKQELHVLNNGELFSKDYVKV